MLCNKALNLQLKLAEKINQSLVDVLKPTI